MIDRTLVEQLPRKYGISDAVNIGLEMLLEKLGEECPQKRRVG